MHLTLEKPSPAFRIKQLYMKKSKFLAFVLKWEKRTNDFLTNVTKKTRIKWELLPCPIYSCRITPEN